VSKSKHSGRNLLFKIIFLLLLTGAGLVVFGHQLPWPLPEPIYSLNQQFNPYRQDIMSSLSSQSNSSKLPINSENLSGIEAQLKTLAEKGQLFSEQAGQVLGEAVKASDQEQPLTDKAFEYGQYLYCQQVVDEWNKNQSD